MTDYREQLRQIRTFPSLVRFLRDELDWPVETDDFEELTFDYEPEELGIDKANAAKIDEIKRLRPLAPNQPWGIFFVKFEPKQLPVVALRRILAGVVVTKRATASAAEQPKWAEDDLLFISNYGEGDERKISFAHFSKDPAKSDLPTLKVIAWDELDTPLHLDHTADLLVERLSWPADEDEWDDETWRERWSSAFELRHREVITTSKVLAERLAELARCIRAEILRVLEIETEDGKVTRLMKSFQEALVHDLDADDFADMYAQTIAYGLLSARIADPHGQTADDLAAHMRTNPFLRELLETFLRVGGRSGTAGGPGIDFDELGVGDVVALLDDANMEAVVLDFGDKNPLEDPVIHFYEHFLSEYDKQLKIQRGVFYTPQPVVSYIVRSVHELLQTEFGLADGLADTTTWGAMLEKHPGLALPPLTDDPEETRTISPDEPFVQILDPATGTATFLVEVIDIIHRTLAAKWKEQRLSDAQQRAAWSDYVPQHLLPRLHAFELMMAPYAIAHLKIGLKLAETGYDFSTEERARIYLTNALEPWQKQLKLSDFDALAHEAAAVNEVKRHKRFTVVIGNPPYSKLSANLAPEHRQLIEPFRFVDGQRVVERGALALEMNLQDDYVKFVRLAQMTLSTTGAGVVGLITNHGYLSTPTLRGMRWSLLHSFSAIAVLDLHGHSAKGEKTPEGGKDENVFDIVQGVAVSFYVQATQSQSQASVRHVDLYGLRSQKYEKLQRSSIPTDSWHGLNPTAENFRFVPEEVASLGEFTKWPSLAKMLELSSDGIVTARDGLVVGFSREELLARIEAFRDTQEAARDVCQLFGIAPESAGFDAEKAIQALRNENDLEQHIIQIQYRPFDYRFLFYFKGLIQSMRWPVTSQLSVTGNLLLAVTRQVNRPQYEHALVSKLMFEKKTVSHDRNTQVFPLLVLPAVDGRLIAETPRSNWSSSMRTLWEKLSGSDIADPTHALRPLHYTYAVLHSPTYRDRYFPFLRADFPRVPIPTNKELLDALSGVGGELTALHLLESPRLAQPITEFIGGRHPEVGRVGWSDDSVWINAGRTNAREGHRATVAGSVGFDGVPEAVWDFHIGGYQVCHKWLKDRKGRTLSDDDISHYEKIVVAISETIRLMAEIDEVIEEHGGWPGAFVTSAGEAEA